ncbi:hypothetical protein [Burkholderia sp. PU8-34]
MRILGLHSWAPVTALIEMNLAAEYDTSCSKREIASRPLRAAD